ncbi:MAG: glycosyltransferase family 39 protein [Patescibacteria group bacterium]
MNLKTKLITIVLPALIFGLALFYASYHLTESPPTWMDEGEIIQLAKNWVLTGQPQFQFTPGQFLSASFISTGFPVTAPIAGAFYLFGQSLWSARLVMVIYLLAFLALAYYLARQRFGPLLANWSLALLAFFPPLYGSGKNVLGEIPGTFWLLVSVVFAYRLETKWSRGAEIKWWEYSALGLGVGLCLATKPFFLPFLLPFGLWLSYLSYRHPTARGARTLALILGPLLATLVLWLLTQFRGDSLWFILTYYANPHGTNLGVSIIDNLKLIFSSAQTLYFLGLLALWSLGLVFVFKRREQKATELMLWFFAGLVTLAYLRNPAYYRYFLVPELLALLYLPVSLERLPLKKYFRLASTLLLSALILVQFYQLNFTAWVVRYYGSNRSAVAQARLAQLNPQDSVLLDTAPELVIFLPHTNYYQYLGGTKAWQPLGEREKFVAPLKPNLVIMSRGLWESVAFSSYPAYAPVEYFSSYLIAKRLK